MKLSILQDEKELSIVAANMVIEQIEKKPNSVVVFPTGTTPLGMFDQLVEKYSEEKVSFNKSYLLELDEYFGIGLNDPRNLFAWLDRTLIKKVDFLQENVFRFNSNSKDPDAEIKRIEEIIQTKKGIDILVLGLGPNGHIGFNEPGSLPSSPTRIVPLSQESLQSNARYWDINSPVPKYGFTLGMNTLLNAKKVIMLVQGSSKAEILNIALNNAISDEIPASHLRNLENFTVLADQEAASKLEIE